MELQRGAENEKRAGEERSAMRDRAEYRIGMERGGK